MKHNFNKYIVFWLSQSVSQLGSGMAVMFLCTGVLGCLFSLVSYQQKELGELD